MPPAVAGACARVTAVLSLIFWATFSFHARKRASRFGLRARGAPPEPASAPAAERAGGGCGEGAVAPVAAGRLPLDAPAQGRVTPGAGASPPVLSTP